LNYDKNTAIKVAIVYNNGDRNTQQRSKNLNSN